MNGMNLEALNYLEQLHNFSGQLCVINDYCRGELYEIKQ